MARKEYMVIDIVDILRRAQRGDTIRSLARATGMGRNTVKKYLRLAYKKGYLRGRMRPRKDSRRRHHGAQRQPPRSCPLEGAGTSSPKGGDQGMDREGAPHPYEDPPQTHEARH